MNLLPDDLPPQEELPPWLWLLIVCGGIVVLMVILWLVDWMFR